MTKGRKPKPIAVKIATGTYRADRDGTLESHVAAVPLAKAPAPLKTLGPAGKAAWVETAERLVRLSVLTESDLGLLGRYCRAHDEVAELDAIVAKEGRHYISPKGEVKQHPAVNERLRWLEIIRRAETELGLTPSSKRNLRVEDSSKQPSGIKPRHRA
jgi:P27 family predicted phage terminase small subunit